MRRTWILGLIAILAAASPVLALRCARTTSLLGAGESLGVVAIDDLAVIGAGPEVVVFDMTDPAEPILLGATAFGDAAIPVGTIDGRVLAFVSVGQKNRLALIDPNLGGSPQEFSSVDLPDGLWPDDLVVVGDTAWIVTSSRDDGLLGVDLTDPAYPEVITRFALPRPASSITAANEHLLMTTWDGLLIADISEPTTPDLVGSLELNWPHSVVAIADRAYVASISALHTIDITNSSEPSILSTVDIDREAAPLSMIVMDDRLIIGLVDFHPMFALPDGGLISFDINDPDLPAAISNTKFSSGPRALAVSGEAFVAADAERGLRVFDSDPAGGHEEIARRNITIDDAFSLAVHGDLAYLGDQGLSVFDISDHRAPVLLASVELDGEIYDVEVNETGSLIATLNHWSAHMYLLDAADPENPVVAYSGPNDGWDLALSGQTLAVAADRNGLLLFDVSDPAHPLELSVIPTSGRAISVAMDGDIAAVGMLLTSGLGSMAVYDVGDPLNPILLSQTATQERVHDIEIDGPRAAIVAWDTVTYFDLTDPTAPLEVGRFTGNGRIANGLALDGDRVHLSSWPGGLQILDFFAASTPRRVIHTWWFPFPIVDGYPLGGYDVAVHEGASIIADGQFGLRVIEVKKCAPWSGKDQPVSTAD